MEAHDSATHNSRIHSENSSQNMARLLGTCQTRTVLTTQPGFVVVPVERGQLINVTKLVTYYRQRIEYSLHIKSQFFLFWT